MPYFSPGKHCVLMTFPFLVIFYPNPQEESLVLSGEGADFVLHLVKRKAQSGSHPEVNGADSRSSPAWRGQRREQWGDGATPFLGYEALS